MDEEPFPIYLRLVQDGTLRPDQAQESAVERLQALYEDLKRGENLLRPQRSILSRLGLRQNHPIPSGIYLFGGVGRGKTMLMDLFYRVVSVEPKRRVHFHMFMHEVHRWIHLWRKKGGAGKGNADPIPPLAQDLASKISLLCLDEFEIRDVTDAMIMRRLFSALWNENIVVVMTSNWSPENLYPNGLQRSSFLPFIDLLKQQVGVVDLGSGLDYRSLSMQRKQVYYTPSGSVESFDMDPIFRDLVGEADTTEEILLVDGRKVLVPRVNQGIAWFTFKELCTKPLGAADYIAVARRFHTLLISDIPIMSLEHRNEARRFATLIDILYEKNVKLVCNAAAVPELLYPSGYGASEFRRTASRLNEMQTARYLSRVHRN